jgi:hypothetical protein
MLKLLIYLIIGFAIYRFYISPIKSALEQRTKPSNEKPNKTSSQDDSEYVDYEEIK